ncbi:ribonuclease D [Caenispirillum bisanense]|uniref:Ribonuclease D n=1 Tax=Caenispirillum bisanense TaxID=414052 RepID=A0A286G6H6_9PROT|nr:ribonuclease D [Caenispirillum bisanense]SOD90574.1 ribonuclease D [Caenispirillum bisanense]
MTLIADSAALRALCDRLSKAEYVTVDTEFMRDRTYWPGLCLVQVAGPDEAWCIDPLAPDIDLTPLFDLMRNEAVLKVFHAARQDLEIFYRAMGDFPRPLFDTQVAAMVCGFGESVGYETLATKLAKARIDKSMRFTDWTRRPLTERQLHYALADVTHLRMVYEKLRKRLERDGRAHWLNEEMDSLVDPEKYSFDPDQAWLRLKPRTKSPRFLAVLKEVAAWREREAQTKDMPRQRVLKDEAILEIAAHAPSSVDELAHVRAISRSTAEGRLGREILDAIARGKAVPEAEAPVMAPKRDVPPGVGPAIDLLRVLLKMRCEEHDVAQKMVASMDDLELLAMDDDADVPAIQGWRRLVFGEDALKLKRGKLALALSGDGGVKALDLED